MRRPGAQRMVRDMHTNGSPFDFVPLLPAAGNGHGRRLTRDEVMTAAEVAELLHLPVSTVYELARRGELPAHRLGRTWRFLRPRLEELLDA